MDNPLHMAGKLVGIDIPGTSLTPEVKLHLEKYRFGGVCVFRKNIHNRQQLAGLVQEIRAVLPEAWISIDQEGGAVLRTSDLPQPPSAMALGAIDDPGMAQAVGAATARGLRSLGINWDYAPVLDVNVNPANPVIGERSFGSDPKKVAELGIAWLRGLQGEGVAATVKHFPGHGDTHLDSHLALPVVKKDRRKLNMVELYPFRKALRAGVAAVMTAHIIYPALDPDHPATLSKAILTGLLREEWGYQGVIVTDSMGMKAIADHYPAGQAALRSVLAGADTVLALGALETQIQQVLALAKAIESGVISRERLSESYRRLEALSQRFPAGAEPYPGEAEDRALMEEAAYRSITATQDLPLPQPTDRILLVTPEAAVGENVYETGPSAERLAQALSRHFTHLEVLTFPHEHPEYALAELAKAAHHADFLLYASTSRQALGEGELQLARAIFEQHKPALHLALWNPYHTAALNQPALLSYGFRQPSLNALAEVLAGKPILGKLPIRLS